MISFYHGNIQVMLYRLKVINLKRLVLMFMCFLFSGIAYSQSFTHEQALVLQQVLTEDGYIDKEMHRRFWTEIPVFSKEEWIPLQKWLISQTTFLHEYQKELWESVMISQVYGKVVKTGKLIELEGELDQRINEKVPFSKNGTDYSAFSNSFVSQLEISKKNAGVMLQSITNKEPLTDVRGEAVILDELFIKNMLGQLDSSFIRLKALLDPAWAESGENHLVQNVTLRSSYKKLSVPQVQAMRNISVHKKHEKGFYGYSTINHDYALKIINGDNVVVDYVTNLMWLQSGSSEPMTWQEAKKWVSGLRERGYAGYNDWRLPTLEEAVSLLELSRNNGGLYIEPVFGKEQRWVWTGDNHHGSQTAAWGVYFNYGLVVWYGDNYFYVRPVRTMKPRDLVAWLSELFDYCCLFFSL